MKKLIILFVVLLIAAIVAVPLYLRHQRPKQPPADTALTLTNVWREIQSYPFQDDTLVLKSVVYESGRHLDSRNATERHNLFGMRCSMRGYPCESWYSVYPEWRQSIKDRYDHEVRWYQGGDYRAYIDRNWGLMDGLYTKTLDAINVDKVTNNK